MTMLLSGLFRANPHIRGICSHMWAFFLFKKPAPEEKGEKTRGLAVFIGSYRIATDPWGPAECCNRRCFPDPSGSYSICMSLQLLS